MVNKQLREEEDPLPAPRRPANKSRVSTSDPLETLGARVAAKLEEADFKGAVRLACSEDSSVLPKGTKRGGPPLFKSLFCFVVVKEMCGMSVNALMW